MTNFSAEDVTRLSGPPELQARRRSALERFAELPLPTTALEEWRYSRIDDIDLDRYRPAERRHLTPYLHGGNVAELVASLGEPAVVVTISEGGDLAMSGSDPAVTVTDLGAGGTAGGWDAIGAVAGRPDPFAVLNEALAPAPLLIEVARGQAVRRPIVVVNWCGEVGAAAFARTVVRMAPMAEATVVEIHASADVDCLTAPVTELDVGDGAHLAYTQVQLLGPRATQLGHLSARGGRDSSVTAAAVALGGDYARLRTSASLVAPGGESRLLAVYFGIGEQMHDFRTVQDHQAPRTTSDLLFKGVVANRAHSVYTGLIRVAKGAAGTNAFQTNRNLVLHEGAHADSVPNLEIEDNDVRCSHASAVGPISDDQRFYLESRGVPTGAAERLITLGFLGEVLAELPGAPASPLLRAAVAAKLSAATEAEAGLVAAASAVWGSEGR